MTEKKISILGSSGSIGTQTLEVVSQSPGRFKIKALTVNSNIEVLEKQCKEFSPETVVIADEKAYHRFESSTRFKGRILTGTEGLQEISSDKDTDLLVSALVGFAGVLPTLAAVESGIDIALANKETLVAAGEIIMRSAKASGSTILPVDSEHSAIFQCLQGERDEYIDELILTASGGPFFKKPELDFDKVSVEDALDHPNWTMGSKVTIDSATMMNKGLEVIEAYRLFDISPKRIKVLVHPGSIIHSLVRFKDTSVKAQLGSPDMRMPISYALNYPERLDYDFKTLDLETLSELEFFKPDFDRFGCLKLAFEAGEEGGSATTALNAANEIAVAAFLNREISFADIMRVCAETLEKFETKQNCDIDEIIAIDKEVKEKAGEIKNEIISRKKK